MHEISFLQLGNKRQKYNFFENEVFFFWIKYLGTK